MHKKSIYAEKICLFQARGEFELEGCGRIAEETQQESHKGIPLKIFSENRIFSLAI